MELRIISEHYGIDWDDIRQQCESSVAYFYYNFVIVNGRYPNIRDIDNHYLRSIYKLSKTDET